MGRQLRSRASRPNYASLYQFEDEDNDGASPSIVAPVVLEDDDSGSDFTEEQAEAEHNEEDMDVAADEEERIDDNVTPAATPSISVVATPSGSKNKTKAGAGASAKTKAVSFIPGITNSSSRQMYSLPSMHHRHRAIPLFDRTGPVERLSQQPVPFVPPQVVPTSSWSSPIAKDRVSKAWGYNAGPGPLWELLEDRGWFKESTESGGENSKDEKLRRPRVCEDIATQHFEILSVQDAQHYLPQGVNISGRDNPTLPRKIRCSFGPFGKQTKVEMGMFDTRHLGEFIPESSSHVFSPGAPVWGLDWCPIHPDDREYYSHKQYLAVAPSPSITHSPSIGVRASRPARACIQTWSLGPTRNIMQVDEVGETGAVHINDLGKMRCELVLCIDSGPALELRWCPLPSNDPVQPSSSNSAQPSSRKLGILAGTFEDGSLSLYAVPDPTSPPFGESQASAALGPICIKISQPLLRIELEDTSCWALDWANSEVIAVGCTNGAIAVYNVAEALKSGLKEDVLPTHYFTVHQSAIRTLSWLRVPVPSAKGERTTDDPTVIASGGYDGVQCLSDIRDQAGNVMNRTRDVVNTLCYSTYCGGPITIDHENIIKLYSASPSMLGRGHTILEPDGPAWSLHASDYHPQLAVGVTDGSCLTTNTLRTTRRGGTVPFLVHKIYQLDYSRKDGEWRMLEKFLPQEMLDRPTASRSTKDKVVPVGTGAWPREVAVQRVVWNTGNGLANAPWLASATGSGLCRVDWLRGRWFRGHVPYYSIQGIRGEIAGVVDEKMEDSD